MENLKISVKSEADIQVCRRLFEQLGYVFTDMSFVANPSSLQVFSDGSGSLFEDHDSCCNEEITREQLKEKVILHRNNVNDANHTDQDGWKWFISSTGVGYVFAVGNAENIPRWDESPLDHVELKPIQKPQSALITEMSEVKEYLDPEDNYSYHKCAVIAQGTKWIEIPDGAELYAHWPMNKNESFHSGTSFFESDEWNCCAWDVEQIKSGVSGAKILWQRTEPQSENKVHTIKVKGFEDLIEGPAALRAALDGQTVQMSLEPWEEKHWDDFLPQYDETSTKIFFTGTTKDGKKVFFRLKPQFIKIGELTVPAPVSPDTQALPEDTDFWIADPSRHDGEFTRKLNWDGALCDRQHLKRGLVHLTKADASAHAKALILVSGGSIN